MRRTLLLAASLLTLAVPATASAAAPGTIAGALGVSVPAGADAQVRAIDRATGVIAATGPVSRRGTFSLTLPAGAYTLVGSVVPRRGAPVQVLSAVTLRAGQRRKAANLKRKRKKKAKARAAYVQERGQITPGAVAVEIPDVTGTLTGDFGAVRRGLNDVATTDVVTGGEECGIAVLEVDRRGDILKELEFQQSPYVDPSTRVQRNFILGDVEVVGRATQAGAQAIDLAYTVRDKRTGATLGSAKGRVSAETFFDDLEKLNRDLTDELCKLSDTYEVTLQGNGRGNFATHSATATLQAEKITAKRAGRKARTWTGSGNLSWANVAFSSKTGCPYINPVVPTITWNVTLEVAGEDQLKLTWGWDGNDSPTASVDCPPDSPDAADPPPVPGQPATSLLNTGPTSFTLPFAGITQSIRGEISLGADGFFTDGQMVVKRGPIVRTDG